MDEETCSKCGQHAQYKCERCLEPYCSSQCQIHDWQDHKSKCYKFPNLVPINILKSVSNLHLDRIGGSQRRNSGSIHSGNDSRRSNTCVNGNKTKPKTLLSDNDFNMVPKVSSNTPTIVAAKPITEKTATWRVAFPPSEGFFDAIVQFKEEVETEKRIVWVTDLKYDSSLRKLLAEMNRSINQNCPCDIDDIHQGALVAAPLERVLYRAEVLESSSDNQKATVRLIDYGNELRVSLSQLFPPIPIMCNLNAYSFQVCLPNDYGPVEIESIVTIRILGEKQFDNYYNVECKSKSISLQLPVELLNKEHNLKLVKCFPDGRNALLRLCTSGCLNQDLDNLLNSPESLSFELDSIPKVGAFVAARTQCGWKRSRLLGFYEKQNQFMVYAIDEGFINFSPQIKRIPDSFITHPIVVFAISTSSADCMLSEPMLSSAKRLNFQLVAGAKNCKSQMQCGLFNEDRQIVDILTVSVFTGSINELGIKLWHEQINEGDTVVVSHVLTYKEIYITSQQNNDYSKILENEYLKCVRFGADDPIQKDDIVMFSSNKGNENQCNRGQVLKCEGNQYKIVDIDSGSEQFIAHHALRKPTNFVCSLPVRCFRVILMYLESIPTPVANNKALEALETCMQNAVEFDVTFSENKTVDLLFRTKERQSLCKKLLPMVFEPASKQAPTSSVPKVLENTVLPLSPPNTPIAFQPPIAPLTQISHTAQRLDVAAVGEQIFSIKDLKVVPVQCGEKVPLYVLDPSSILDSESPFITAADYSNKESLMEMEQYLKEVSKYCKSDKAPKNGYAPKKSEICLCIFAEDGEWYRALCMDHKPNDIFIVMFLDYGNISKVYKKDVMPMIPDLMFPSNANMVYLEGIKNKEEGLAFMKNILTNPIIYANVRKLHDEEAYIARLCA